MATQETSTTAERTDPFATPWRDAAERLLTAQVTVFQEAMRGQLAALEEMRAIRARLAPRDDQATFKARVTSGGRIVIPDAEREALSLAEGDLVQVIVVPVRKTPRETDPKEKKEE